MKSQVAENRLKSNMKKLLKSFSKSINEEIAYLENKKTCAKLVLSVLEKEKNISDKDKKQFFIDCGL